MPRSLADYFNTISDVIAQRGELAGDSAENGDIGSNREIVVSEFLKRHTPGRFAIELGGDIFNSSNDRSRQIDIILHHDAAMTFKENLRVRCPVESVVAAITVKSRLTKNELFNALDNLASIPRSDPSVIEYGPINTMIGAAARFVRHYPALFVFAYDGLEPDTLRKHIDEYYASNTVTINRTPSAVIINRKHVVLFRWDKESAQAEGRPYTVQFQSTVLADSTRGSPLFWMMLEISKSVSWLDSLHLNFASYYESAYPGGTKPSDPSRFA